VRALRRASPAAPPGPHVPERQHEQRGGDRQPACLQLGKHHLGSGAPRRRTGAGGVDGGSTTGTRPSRAVQVTAEASRAPCDCLARPGGLVCPWGIATRPRRRDSQSRALSTGCSQPATLSGPMRVGRKAKWLISSAEEISTKRPGAGIGLFKRLGKSPKLRDRVSTKGTGAVVRRQRVDHPCSGSFQAISFSPHHAPHLHPPLFLRTLSPRL
jgi:hypothetical protein